MTRFTYRQALTLINDLTDEQLTKPLSIIHGNDEIRCVAFDKVENLTFTNPDLEGVVDRGHYVLLGNLHWASLSVGEVKDVLKRLSPDELDCHVSIGLDSEIFEVTRFVVGITDGNYSLVTTDEVTK